MSLQDIFNDISLTKDVSVWESDVDSVQENRKRLQLLITYSECKFENVLDRNKSVGRKNNKLSEAILKKACSAKKSECLRLLGQAIGFASPGPTKDSILRLRSERLKEMEMYRESLEDLDEIKNKTSKDNEICRITGKLLESLHQDQGGESFPETGDLMKRHPSFEQFSEALEVKSSRGAGRYMTAARDINPGEIIADETSYVALLDRKYSRDHCDYCLKVTVYAVPCANCSSVVFCSVACRKQATYHAAECMVLDQIFRAETEVWHLALRIIASQPLEYWLNESYKKQADVYSSKDTSTVYNLVTHIGEAETPAPVLMKESLTAVFFLRVLQSSGYFGKKCNKIRLELSKEELMIGTLLLHFMRVVFYNSHEVTELQPETQKVVKVGVCLNPTLALINHSCDPNYARVVNGRRPLAFATRLIKKGEEVQDVYSPTFFMLNRRDRLEITERYNFNCICPACRDDWPTEQNMRNRVEQSESWIGELNDVARLEEHLKQTLSSGLDTSLKEVIDVLIESRIKIKHPNKLVLKAEGLLHSLLWRRYAKNF